MMFTQASASQITGIPRKRIAYHAPRWDIEPDREYTDTTGKVHKLYERETVERISSLWSAYQDDRRAKGHRAPGRKPGQKNSSPLPKQRADE